MLFEICCFHRRISPEQRGELTVGRLWVAVRAVGRSEGKVTVWMYIWQWMIPVNVDIYVCFCSSCLKSE